MTESKKGDRLGDFLDEVSKQMFDRSRSASLKGGYCVTCGKDAFPFRDALSRREYMISGMCQKCQDGVFGIVEEDELLDDNQHDLPEDF